MKRNGSITEQIINIYSMSSKLKNTLCSTSFNPILCKILLSKIFYSLPAFGRPRPKVTITARACVLQKVLPNGTKFEALQISSSTKDILQKGLRNRTKLRALHISSSTKDILQKVLQNGTKFGALQISSSTKVIFQKV